MESRQFIKTATALCQRIRDHALLESTVGTSREEGDAIQKAINMSFQGLQNNTLPSAFKLRDVALDNGFFVETRVQQRLYQGECCWPN